MLARHDLSDVRNVPGRIGDHIYADIRHRLTVGELKPSETLSIRKLADFYQVSAMPVRAALGLLAAEGALIGAEKRAYRVPDLSHAEAAELFHVRAVLEGAAAETAARCTTPQDLDQLTRYNADMYRAADLEDANAWLLGNLNFHLHIVSMAGNQTLKRMVELIFARTGPLLAHGVMNLVDADKWNTQHEKIIGALERHNAKAARKQMAKDADWGRQLYLQQ